ncbi:MAG: hypothetical protein M5T61_02445 [Acidimicrobiia bacterium]|nr:hypothetical protein [Acidimicrobiia bacterium]
MTAPQVLLPAGDEASGLATMLADLLRDNMNDYPGRGEGRWTRPRLGGHVRGRPRRLCDALVP